MTTVICGVQEASSLYVSCYCLTWKGEERKEESPHRHESHHSLKQEPLSFHSNPMSLSRAFSQTLTEGTVCSWVRDAVN